MKFPLFPKVSLAMKVGLLFAAAVLLIVSAALFVPWDRMQRLVAEQDITEARHLANIRLMERCSGLPLGAREGAPPSTNSDSPEGFFVDQPGRLGELWNRLRTDGPQDWPTTLFLAPPPEAKSTRGFLREAMKNFSAHPDDPDYWEYRYRRPPPESQPDSATQPDADKDQRVFEYVRALRITDNCAGCHAGATSPRPLPTDKLVGLIYVQMPPQEPLLWYRVPINLALVLAAGTLAVVLAVVVFYVVMKSLVLSPVRKLRRLADHIGEGDLSVRSTIRTGDEFERLAKAFNSMLERLQVSQQQLRQINESLNSKMDELAKANVALFESNRLKSEFLARVSHELRTPLNSIIGFAEVLRDQMAEAQARDEDKASGSGQQAPGEEMRANGAEASKLMPDASSTFDLRPSTLAKAARYADNILTSGRMLLELINDLLDLSKIEAGKMAVRIEKVVVRDLVEAVVNFMRPAAEKNNLQVTVEIDPELPLVETDGGKLQQILYNLFSNAVKFTPPRGSVTVRAWRAEGDAGELALSVRDTGPGIPPEDQESIFEKFHQLDSPATREHGGTGLGLSISRELADMLGGRLTLASKLGEGSTFTVILPLRPGEMNGEGQVRR